MSSDLHWWVDIQNGIIKDPQIVQEILDDLLIKSDSQHKDTYNIIYMNLVDNIGKLILLKDNSDNAKLLSDEVAVAIFDFYLHKIYRQKPTKYYLIQWTENPCLHRGIIEHIYSLIQGHPVVTKELVQSNTDTSLNPLSP